MRHLSLERIDTAARRSANSTIAQDIHLAGSLFRSGSTGSSCREIRLSHELAKEFCVHAGEAVELKRRPTLVKPVYKSKQEYKQLLDEDVARLSALQELLYASNQYALLIIFQASTLPGKTARSSTSCPV